VLATHQRLSAASTTHVASITRPFCTGDDGDLGGWVDGVPPGGAAHSGRRGQEGGGTVRYIAPRLTLGAPPPGNGYITAAVVRGDVLAGDGAHVACESQPTASC
jgi:hypothetical protein